jgi:antitoxin ParD1/3/4
VASSIEKISIALPPEMVASLRQAVEAGEYSSSSEVVREALRDWSHKRQLQQNGIEELRSVWRAARDRDGLRIERAVQENRLLPALFQ